MRGLLILCGTRVDIHLMDLRQHPIESSREEPPRLSRTVGENQFRTLRRFVFDDFYLYLNLF